MEEIDFQTLLKDIIFESDQTRRIETFAQACILTNNKGLVLRMNDDSEFQITIVRSKRSPTETLIE